MKRRAFVSVAGLGITAIGVTLIDFIDFDFFRPAYCKPEFMSHLCSNEGLRALGQEYLSLYPAERSCDLLITKLCGRPPGIESFSRKEIRSIRQRLKDAIKKDFFAGRTVILGGWVLSLTEARQCALFTLLDL